LTNSIGLILYNKGFIQNPGTKKRSKIAMINADITQYLILAIATLGTLSLPYISIQLYRTTDKILFSLFVGLFGMLCVFVAFVGYGTILNLF